VDLFDAGPTMQADRPHIHTVRKSHRTVVKAICEVKSEKHLICNTRLHDFMIVAGQFEMEGGGIAIAPETAKALDVKIGDAVRYVL
jgi:arginine/ornithine N-succinyltransferase beta subunit